VIGLPSAGEGQGGGIGDKGNGHGDGPGIGPGAGPGSNGGKGGPNGIVRIGEGGASPPSCPIPSSEPAYTDAARRAQIQGTVALDVIVNRDGTVSVSGIAQRIGYGLDDEASHFVARTFRCQPGTYQGESVATPARIDVNFHLY
jgi:TonB family protein